MKKQNLFIFLNFFSLCLVFSVFFSQYASAQSLDVSAFETLSIQDGGRNKPFDSFARESVQLITGSQSYQKKNPTELVLSWLFLPSEWSKLKFIQIKHLELKKELGIVVDESYISPSQVMGFEKLPSLMTALERKQKEKRKLSSYDSAINRLRNQVILYNEIISGRAFKLIPQKLSHDWLSISELKDQGKVLFEALAAGYFTAIAKKNPETLTIKVLEFKKFAQGEGAYPSDGELKMEVQYNKLHPFLWAAILYFFAAVLFLITLVTGRKVFATYAVLISISGLIFHIYGFGVRCWIAGRPPVSNMYESIVWMALGCMVIGLTFEKIYKKVFTGFAATMMSALALLVANSVPAVLDQSLRPLEPVLKSNLWLTVHVLTIVLSYAPFTLAAGLGNVGLFIYLKGNAEKEKEKLKLLALYVYKSLQVGVLLLTAGTILGGVWADYSWGRFWGWDPKETWALIADLCYLAILHGRFTGWLKTFGTIASAVCCYAAVIMAWYGVNFVLGEGLHSYGFGSGGVQYVAGVLVLQLIFVAAAYMKFKSQSHSKV